MLAGNLIMRYRKKAMLYGGNSILIPHIGDEFATPSHKVCKTTDTPMTIAGGSPTIAGKPITVAFNTVTVGSTTKRTVGVSRTSIRKTPMAACTKTMIIDKSMMITIDLTPTFGKPMTCAYNSKITVDRPSAVVCIPSTVDCFQNFAISFSYATY